MGMLVDLDHLMVVVDDDDAIDHSPHASGRRGVAGTMIVEKIVGAAAEAGADLFDCKALGNGEPGRRRMPFAPAAEIVDLLLDPILKDLALARGRDVPLHVNGLGGTPLMELYLLHHHARKRLHDEGLNVVRTLVGNHTTSLEMAGAVDDGHRAR